MIVGTLLIGNIYTTHLIIVVRSKGRNRNFLVGIFSPNISYDVSIARIFVRTMAVMQFPVEVISLVYCFKKAYKNIILLKIYPR